MEKFEINQNNNKETLEAPEGWKTRLTIANDIKTDASTIQRIADKYKDSNPEYFKDFKDKKNGRIWKYYSPELTGIITKEMEKYVEPLPGWKSIKGASLEFNVAYSTIKSIADQYRKSHPEYFAIFRNKKGIYKHFSPELLGIIKKETEDFRQLKEAPEEWMTNAEVYKKLKSSQITIEEIVNKYRDNNPEYFNKFKSKNGKIYEYYSPKLLQIIYSEISKYETAPNNWKTNTALSNELTINFGVLSTIANKYRKTNPEYFKKYKSKSGALFEHYSPEFIQILSNEAEKIKKIPEAPEGWMTNKTLSKSLNRGQQTITNITDNYRDSNPDYFKEFKSKVGNAREHYSPELVEIIKKELEDKNKNIPEVPENWQSTKDISERTGVSKEEVEKIAQRIREKYQGQFGKFKDRKI